MNDPLLKRPADLALRWTREDVDAFQGFRQASGQWDAWRAHHVPSDEQVYRKLLLDLLVPYMQANHFGDDFSTSDSPNSEFNQCTGRPVRSSEDYVERTRVLLDAVLGSHLSAEDVGNALFRFLLSGAP